MTDTPEPVETTSQASITRIRFDHDLFFGDATPGDVIVDVGGLAMHLDAGSAFRANGVRIGFVEGPSGKGFKIENPNAVKSCGCGSSFSTEEEGIEGLKSGGGGCGSCGH